tara:strand:+ start:1005 stop:2465 length:1461 start_codon:yes stop_codon:yes gene_type:complete
MQIPFGEWLPDQPEHLNPGANVANNVYHAQKSYKRFPSLVAYSSNNIGKNSTGAGSFRDNSNAVFNFVATKTDIYQLASGAFTSRKSSLTANNDDFTTFTQFGEYVVASNGVDAPQYYLMGTSTNFANLSTIVTAGTLPVFRVSGVVRDFFVTGNITNNTNRIQWSGINDLGTWSGKQSDSQDLPGSGGQVVHITSGEIGYVFRQNQIIRMDYVGGNTVFRLSVISPNRGSMYGRTVCQDNRQVFFYADDGFYQINGDSVLPIGVEKVNRFFDLNLNKAFADRICAAVDPFNQLAMWLYPSVDNTSNTTGICDKIIIYNYATKKWSLATANASTIFSQFVGAYTVELMDIISQSLENINAALDTDFWSGGQMLLGAIDSDYKAAIFSGNNNECEVETSEIEPFPGLRTNITGIRPIVDAAATVTLKSRERLADSETESTSSSMVTSGINPVRKSGRYIRANVKVPSGTTFNHAQGVDIVASRAGVR